MSMPSDNLLHEEITLREHLSSNDVADAKSILDDKRGVDRTKFMTEAEGLRKFRVYYDPEIVSIKELHECVVHFK